MQSDCTILELIQSYKRDGNDQSLVSIIDRMEPLLKKYARALYYFEYEDMHQELIIALIEAVKRIQTLDNEGKVMRYIINGVKNRFLELYRKQTIQKQEINYEDIEDISNKTEGNEPFKDIEFYIDIGMISVLQKKTIKSKIAEYIIYNEATDSEIAEKLHISRQYVNRCKKEIFNELRKS